MKKPNYQKRALCLVGGIASLAGVMICTDLVEQINSVFALIGLILACGVLTIIAGVLFHKLTEDL